MAYKKLNDKKMGDVGIHNDGGTNIIFHANKTTMSNKDKQMLVEASSAKAAPTRLDHYADKPNDLSRCDKALSTSVNENSTTKEIQSQGNELLTIHSETRRDERGQLRREFNDRNFHNPVSTKISITQNQTESQGTNLKQAKIKTLKDEVKKISEKNIQTKDRDIER